MKIAGALSYVFLASFSYPLYTIGQNLNPVFAKGSSYNSEVKKTQNVILKVPWSKPALFGTCNTLLPFNAALYPEPPNEGPA